MAVYVIADLHLDGKSQYLCQAFKAFVSRLQSHDELYILGDLFNFFVGLDKQDGAQQIVKEVLLQAKQRGVKSFFLHGNRDFLLSQDDACALNMTLCTDFYVLSVGAHNILLTHGDLFCSNDTDYLKYHRTVNNKFLQCLFKALPLRIRRKIGSSIREKSHNATHYRQDTSKYGVVENCVANYVDKHSLPNQCIDIVVHGHIHCFSKIDKPCKQVKARYVLGAWGENYSYLSIANDGTITFCEESIDDNLRIE